ncbi:DUF6443 domain-containing protein [Flavobacterium sp.]|uniref:DUF6443 domain-containing protein n=1 Tax=Flavobacterium sp. TaxID=239 RepID=UPI004034CBF1
MKKLLYLLQMFPVMVLAQTSTQNYVRTYVYKQPTEESDASKAQASVTYVDGLGRPVQQVVGKASATGKDIVTHMEYDKYNRTQREYLPYPASTADLSYTDGAKAGTFGYYSSATDIEHTGNPYSRTLYEASPLNRILRTTAPGDPWAMDDTNANDHSIKFAYQVNTANVDDLIKKLRAVATWNNTTQLYDIAYVSDGNFPRGKVYKTITQDENKTGIVYTGMTLALKNNTTEEFKNTEGQVLVKRTFNNGVKYDTYYLYDQFGNLTYVLPPTCEGSFANGNANVYGYQYKYDARNRLVEKKLPGKQWEYIVYDPLDRVVATGPALSPFGDGATGWLHTYYDAFGRVALTGWAPQATINSAARNILQQAAIVKNTGRQDQQVDGVDINYKPGVLPSEFKLLTITYYDDYAWQGAPATLPPSVEGESVRTFCRGLATGTWVRALTAPSEILADVTYTLYDTKGRPLRSHTDNYLGGYTETDTKMDFDGTPQHTVTRHKRVTADNELVTREEFTYTDQDRLLTHTHQINSLNAELMSFNVYTELGQLKNKKVGGGDTTAAAYYQKVDYKYNVRGWLTDINNIDVPPNSVENDLFAFRISYNTVTDVVGGVKPLYNGNISETYWRSGNDFNRRKYSYEYDHQNRLTGSYYQKPDAAIQLNNSYNEMASYDKNGNILTLNRNGGLDDPNFVVEIDNLAYTYTGNQLMKVADSQNSPQGFRDGSNTDNDYSYDVYGNMKEDKNKGITAISYNHLNLPAEIQFGGTTKKINYLYNAAGAKLKKTVTDGTTVVIIDYLGGYHYKKSVLQFFPTAEGYVDCTPGGSAGTMEFNYVYQYKDHLGNVRVNYAGRNGEAIIKDESHYYPFGLKHLNYNMEEYEYQNQGGSVVLLPALDPTSKLKYNYKYNGKELQDELGLNMYDYGARNYDPAIGRWMNIDPLAETSRRWSPYTYCYNNPMRFVDPDGMMAIENDDIIVLSQSSQENHYSGHQAVLIGDDKNGWTYYSLDGDVTGTDNDQQTTAQFTTLEDFTNSEHNTFKADYDDKNGTQTSEKDSDGNIKQRYDQGYRIKTTKAQDEKMKKAAKETVDNGFGFNTNCTTVATEALDAAGLNNGEVSNDGPFGLSFGNYWPSSKQKEIEKSNPGKDIDNLLVPNK